MRAIPDTAVELVLRWEGVKLVAYQDIVNVWTIGAGHTGPDVVPGLRITQAQARALLKDDLKIAATRLHARIGDVVEELSENQYAALLSFVFNLGANPSWTIWKVLKARQFDQVPAQIIRFVNAGGKRVQGLVNRRTAEVALWNAVEHHEEPLPSSVTRSIETPPTPIDSKPLVQSKSFMTAGATTIAAGSAAVAQVTQTLQPFSYNSELVGRVVSTLAVIGAALALATLIFVWLKKKRT